MMAGQKVEEEEEEAKTEWNDMTHSRFNWCCEKMKRY